MFPVALERGSGMRLESFPFLIRWTIKNNFRTFQRVFNSSFLLYTPFSKFSSCFFLFRKGQFKRAKVDDFLVAVRWIKLVIWGPFLESPETFRAHFGWHNSLCIFKTMASRGTKLCSYFNFYSLYNIWKDQLCRISGSEFNEWLFGPEKFSGLSRNGPLIGKLKKKTMSAKSRWMQNDIKENRSWWLGACNSHIKPMPRYFYRLIYF